MFDNHFFVTPNVFHSGSSLDGYSLVTGSSQLANGAKLLGLIAENTSGSTAWIQVHDGYAQPSGSAVPLVSLKTTAGQQVSLDCQAFNCLPVTKGIVVALSSTGPTYTSVSAAMWISAFWI